MELVRIIHERGITVAKIENEWHLLNKDGGGTVRVEQPTTASLLYGVRPILVTERIEDREFDSLLWKTKHERFSLKRAEISELANYPNVFLYDGINVSYLLESVEYHCTQLCKKYASICRDHIETSLIPGSGRSDDTVWCGNSEPYFEFDALITTVRRAYDSLRYPIWKHLSPKPKTGSLPISFHKTLVQCKDDLPSGVFQQLDNNWSIYGEKLKEYRDCIQHYTPIDFGSLVRLDKLDNEIWSARVLIPDNPSAKSRHKFTFGQSIDALTYGWNVANEILEVAIIIKNAIVANQVTHPNTQLGDTDNK